MIPINLADSEEAAVDYLNLSHLKTGSILTAAGEIMQIDTRMQLIDYWHEFRARLSIKRNFLAIPPGLYAIGNPNQQSPVMVTANYKLSFDKLRIELTGLDVWLLVIDTKGVNVWCSAGKGTFSAQEIINRLRRTGLEKVVSHRRLILPQLSAPGVAARFVAKHTGFKIIFGPVRAADIKQFINDGCKANVEMRRVTFDWKERAILTPVELVMAVKYIPIIIVLLTLINFINHSSHISGNLWEVIFYNSLAYVAALVVGTVLTPIMLPALPFRSFALKGAVAGILFSILAIYGYDFFRFSSQLTVWLGNSLLFTALISFLTLNFTGSTPFTSFTGTQNETLQAVPIQLIAAILGIILLVVSRFTLW
jgi:hypothetical protein